jgi:hypothetical protein
MWPCILCNPASYMWPCLLCGPVSYVTLSPMWPCHLCGPVSYVTMFLMWPYLLCDPISYVTLSPIWPSLLCDPICEGVRCGRDHIVVGFTTTSAISALSQLNLWVRISWLTMYSIQHYVIKIVSNLRQVSGFLQVLWFSPPIKLTSMI